MTLKVRAFFSSKRRNMATISKLERDYRSLERHFRELATQGTDLIMREKMDRLQNRLLSTEDRGERMWRYASLMENVAAKAYLRSMFYIDMWQREILKREKLEKRVRKLLVRLDEMQHDPRPRIPSKETLSMTRQLAPTSRRASWSVSSSGKIKSTISCSTTDKGSLSSSSYRMSSGSCIYDSLNTRRTSAPSPVVAGYRAASPRSRSFTPAKFRANDSINEEIEESDDEDDTDDDDDDDLFERMFGPADRAFEEDAAVAASAAPAPEPAAQALTSTAKRNARRSTTKHRLAMASVEEDHRDAVDKEAGGGRGAGDWRDSRSSVHLAIFADRESIELAEPLEHRQSHNDDRLGGECPRRESGGMVQREAGDASAASPATADNDDGDGHDDGSGHGDAFADGDCDADAESKAGVGAATGADTLTSSSWPLSDPHDSVQSTKVAGTGSSTDVTADKPNSALNLRGLASVGTTVAGTVFAVGRTVKQRSQRSLARAGQLIDQWIPFLYSVLWLVAVLGVVGAGYEGAPGAVVAALMAVLLGVLAVVIFCLFVVTLIAVAIKDLRFT